jgi:ferredoxin/flavodoxin---NADP+ reductase
MEEIFDITIVGAGPVGLYALYYAGLRDVKAKIIEALDEVGGGLKVLYPEKYVYDVAGYPKVMSKELVAQFEQQARTYGMPILLGRRVTALRRREDGVIELTAAGETHYSRTVILCIGGGAFIPRTLDIPDVKRLEGAGVFYYIKDSAQFRDKRVLVVGGGDSAVDNALMLEPLARRVVLIHRNDRFRAHEESLQRLLASRIETHYPFWEVKELFGDVWVRGATVVNTFSDEEMTYEIDALILNLGFLTNLKPLREWGLELKLNGLAVDEVMRTNIPGVFAAGDIASHPGKLKLISTGAGEAAVAVNNAVHMIYPAKEVEPEHSSHSKRPDAR